VVKGGRTGRGKTTTQSVAYREPHGVYEGLKFGSLGGGDMDAVALGRGENYKRGVFLNKKLKSKGVQRESGAPHDAMEIGKWLTKFAKNSRGDGRQRPQEGQKKVGKPYGV